MKVRSIMMPMVAAWICALSVCAQMGPVQIAANVKSSVDRKYGVPKNQSGKSKVLLETIYTKQLEMTVKSFSAKKLEGVEVKYWIFGRDREGKNVKAVQAGHEIADLEVMKSVVLESKKATLVYDERERSGMKYDGFAVQAFSEDKLIGEVYEPRNMMKDYQKLIVAEKEAVGQDLKDEKKPKAAQPPKPGDKPKQ